MTRRALPILILAAPLVAAVGAGCKIVHHDGSTTMTAGAGGAGGSAAGTGGGNPAATGRSIFESTVQMPLVAECGACHGLGGVADVPFLAQPDVYVSITSWPGIVVSDPNLSTLITHPADPSHGGGQAPNLTSGTRDKALAWLTYEAAHLPKPDAGCGPLIPPFKPFLMGAFNAIYLDPLGPEFLNSSITFNATEVGSPPSILVLSNIQVHPVAGINLHVTHPLFTVYPPDGSVIPDPADSFSGFDATYAIDTDPTLGTGEVVLSHWEKDSRLGIAFEGIQATSKTGGANTCKDVATFQAQVVPQLKQWTCAPACHAGMKIQAQQQMDLSQIDAMPPADACSQVRARITPGDPASSEILVVTDPTQQAVHLFKFAGNLTNYNTFKAAVTPWIMAEQ